MIRIWICGIAGLIALAGPCQAQTAGRAITGRLIDDIGQQPVRNARLILSGLEIEPMVATSGNTGEFTFTVPAGSYHIRGEKAGFFDLSLDKVEVAAGPVDLGTIVLTQKRRIAGNVRWPDGEPLERARYVAYSVASGQLSIVRLATEGNFTDDRGGFALNGLRPGRYVIRIFVPDSTSGATLRTGLPAYYPGGTSPDVQAPLDLRNRASAEEITIVAEPRRGVDVEGSIVPSANVRAGQRVSLSLCTPDGVTVLQSTTSQIGQPFRFASVPPGPYVLLAFVQEGRLLRAGRLGLIVGSETIRDVLLAIPELGLITGTIEMQTASGRVSVPNVVVRASPTDAPLPTQSTKTDASGQFKMSEVTPGVNYQLVLEQLPGGAYLSELRRQSGELLSRPLVVQPANEPIRMLFKNDGGSVTGRITGQAKGLQPIAVLFPWDRKELHLVQTAAAAADGGFRLDAVPPGTYGLATFPRAEDYAGQESIAASEKHAIQVTVRANAATSVELKTQ